MSRALDEIDDSVICPRKGYSKARPQLCLDMYIKRADLCKECSCSSWKKSLKTMSEACGKTDDEILEICMNGEIDKVSSPVVNKRSLPDVCLMDISMKKEKRGKR